MFDVADVDEPHVVVATTEAFKKDVVDDVQADEQIFAGPVCPTKQYQNKSVFVHQLSFPKQSSNDRGYVLAGPIMSCSRNHGLLIIAAVFIIGYNGYTRIPTDYT